MPEMNNRGLILLNKARHIYSKGGMTSLMRRGIRYTLPRPFNRYFWLLRLEMYEGERAPVPLHDRMKLYRHGFRSYVYNLYGFDERDDWSQFMPCTSRHFDTPMINDCPELIDDKKIFYEHLSDYGLNDFLPLLLGEISDGKFTSHIDSGLFETLEEYGKVVIKDRKGSGGKGVHVCRYEDGLVVVDGRKLSSGSFENFISTIDQALITEYCQQATYLDHIYPKSVNTLRILVVKPDSEEPFIGAVVQRFGTERSAPVDNFTSGGLSCSVDKTSGTLGTGVGKVDEHQFDWYSHHPDTGERIEGVRIPGWDDIKVKVKHATDIIPEFRYVGWDIVVTEPGEFVVLEANNQTDIDLLQAHEPLFKDGRLRSFYAKQDVSV